MTQYDLWLDRIPDIGAAAILALREAMGGDRNFAEEFYRMKGKEREAVALRALDGSRGGHPMRAAKEKAARLAAGAEEEPERYAGELEVQEIGFAVYDDPEYPQRLRGIPDPPFGLYYYGRLPSGTRPSAAIIGTRMASAYGRDQARRFAREIAREGVQIISGMAIGIDGIAGRGALDVDGDTFAVLGCGVDICYPKENADLYGALFDRGGILSEYPPGTEPQRKLFPSRNRIISGLSDVVLVIEAREKSGTLITVDRALEYGIDVYALPGRVSDRNSRGCNELIRQGAGIATGPQDILDYIYGGSAPTAPEDAYSARTKAKDVKPGQGAGQEAEDPLHWPPSGRAGEAAGRGGRSRPVQMSLDFEIFSSPEAEEDLPETGNILSSSPAPDSLTKLERAVYEALDESTPQGVDDLLPEVRRDMGRSVSCQEIMRSITRLDMKDLVYEVRVGNYVRRTSSL